MSIITDIYNPDNFADSSMLLFRKDMNTHIYGGGNISHILNVNINQTPSDDIASQIMQQVFQKINNIPIMFIINKLHVTITWRSNAVSNYYHADVQGIYGDVAVKLHTEMLLKMIDLSTDGDCLGQSSLDFTVTKPLVRTITLLPSEVQITS